MPKDRFDGKIPRTKWITPATRKELVRRARKKSRITFGDIDIASLRFGVPAIAAVIVVLLFQGIPSVAIITAFLLSSTGVLFIGGIRGKYTLRRVYQGEIIRQPDEWKDYYGILRLSPAASPEAIAAAQRRFNNLFDNILSEGTKEVGGLSRKDVDEAVQVLSSRSTRAAYDRVFWLRTNLRGIPAGGPGQQEIVTAMQSVADRIQRKPDSKISWQIPVWGRVTGRVAMTGVIGLLPVVIGGTSLAFAKPENALAATFKGIAISVAKVSTGAVGLLVDIRRIAATQERSIAATALQSMRIDAGLLDITPVLVPTNDMATFPSREHPLYPDYLETRFSQFRYTVDDIGIVRVDASWATTDTFLDSLSRVLERLENESD